MPDEPKPNSDVKKPLEFTEETPVVTTHEAAGLKYTVTTGRMPLRDDQGEIVSQMFYMAYTVDSGKGGAKRPLMFSFNGGPGSPSVWLHLGALGPKRAPMLEDGNLPPGPYDVIDNPHNWLQFTDLVFIDPIGTGFSRSRSPEEAEKNWSIQGDIESVGEFIRLYLTRNNRWNSPLYLVGESYGTTRAAGLAGYCIDRGIAFNGIVLVSSILNFQTARFNRGNDLPYVLFLPTYCATALYHGKASGVTLDQCRRFAEGPYASALAKGDKLSEKERKSVIAELSKLTGLSKTYIDFCDLRIYIQGFCKELLRDERRTVGRLDSRIKGIDDWGKGHTEEPEHDPSMSVLMPPYVSAFCGYVRSQLGYESDLEYLVFKGIKKPWDWGSAGDGHPDTSEALRQCLAKYPYMKLFVASGLYDLATPFFATEYTLAHMGLDPEVRDNFTVQEYEAGHMMYINEPCLTRLCVDVKTFVSQSQSN
ncbi:MAG: hypothetical protein JNM34_01220 [Chthonomonadaceae bacterium]|nr:hypothetical protein [Chthonomonadaceae bacterium]